MKFLPVASLLMLSSLAAQATISLNLFVGVARDSSANPVHDGTLWALVVDADVNQSFYGGFGLNSSLGQAGAQGAFTPGQSITVGANLGGDTVAAIGGFNGGLADGFEGVLDTFRNFTLGLNGMANGRSFAVYWFPGATYSGGSSAQIGSQVGAINPNVNDISGGVDRMVVPPDGATIFTGAASNDQNVGGSLPASRFIANVIPEPSSLLLGMLGGLCLWRRKR